MRVTELEPCDVHRLNAALGWLGLNSPADARAELEGLSEELHAHPAVLEVRWMLAAHEKNWKAALEVADEEIKVMPDNAGGWLHRAYALRRVDGGGIEQAWDVLLPAAEKFPKESVIAYNLSCYACQLNRLETARKWLQQAIATGGKETIRKMALSDDDLKPLWEEISHWS